MKLILARIVFNFDIELMEKEDDWLDQESYILWKRKPLWVKARAAGRR